MASRRRAPVDPVVIESHHCTPTEQRRLLGGAPFFSRLSSSDLDEVAAFFRQADYSEGSIIHHAGDSATRLSIIAAGMVKMVRSTVDGQDVLLDILGPGDHFGSLADLGDRTYREDATAHTNCCILFTTAGAFQDILKRYPEVTLATLNLVAGRLGEAHEAIEQISAYTVDRRVAATLLKLVHRVGRPDGDAILIDMPLSRQDLADMTGAQVETVSRVMSEFRRSGVIESGRRWITVLDREHLANLVSGADN